MFWMSIYPLSYVFRFILSNCFRMKRCKTNLVVLNIFKPQNCIYLHISTFGSPKLLWYCFYITTKNGNWDWFISDSVPQVVKELIAQSFTSDRVLFGIEPGGWVGKKEPQPARINGRSPSPSLVIWKELIKLKHKPLLYPQLPPPKQERENGETSF